MVEGREKPEDLSRVRFRKVIYLLGGGGMLVVGILLLIVFSRRHELPALLLALVALFWCALLIYQSWKTREIERALRDNGGGGDSSEQ